jgi:transposase
MHGLLLLYLWKLLEKSPPDFGWRRPTWTRELLILTLARNLKVRVSPATMSRALHELGARRGKPHPIVMCPWKKVARTRRLNAIRTLLARASAEEPVLFGDEVDVHLNPNIDWDWMLPGQQREVLTPGEKEKPYVAGPLDVRTDELACVERRRKASTLFVALFRRLAEPYPNPCVIHLVVDNRGIHSSRQTQAAVRSLGGRIELHFLPPYRPNKNPIERVWQDLHANVTRNQRSRTMGQPMRELRVWLRRRARSLAVPLWGVA